MSKPPDHPRRKQPRAWQPRFTLPTLLLIMFVAAVMAASAAHPRRAVAGTSTRAVFIIFTLAAPMLLLVLFSLGRLIAGLFSGKSNRRSR